MKRWFFLLLAVALSACAAPAASRYSLIDLPTSEHANAPWPATSASDPAPKAVLTDAGASAADECSSAMFPATPGSGLVVFQDPKTNLYGYRHRAGPVAIAPTFQFAYEFNTHGVAAAVRVVPVFIDTTGRTIAEAFSFDNGPDYFQEGYARIVAQGKMGFLDEYGRVAIAPQFDFVEGFCHGRAVACLGCVDAPDPSGDHRLRVGGAWGVIDREGKWLESPKPRPR